ncbi:hypothetical protein Tco_0685273, partial [Tanacetum coccineum]
ARLSKQVLVEELKEKSISEAEVLAVVEEEEEAEESAAKANPNYISMAILQMRN